MDTILQRAINSDVSLICHLLASVKSDQLFFPCVESLKTAEESKGPGNTLRRCLVLFHFTLGTSIQAYTINVKQ